MSNEKFTRTDNLVAIRAALLANDAPDLAAPIDALLRQDPVKKGEQHRGDSIHDLCAVNLSPETSQRILDVLGTVPDLQGHDALYGGKQIGFLLNEFRRCVN
jgi:hypothetical protein